MDVLGKIERMRKERGWSEYELAKRSGIPQTTLSSQHRKNHMPTIPTLEAICKAFGITMSQFFADSNVPVELTEEQKEMLEKWNTLDDDKKQALLRLMETM
jgi:transcriptional regulator with XRE-family HTH domain